MIFRRTKNQVRRQTSKNHPKRNEHFETQFKINFYEKYAKKSENNLLKTHAKKAQMHKKQGRIYYINIILVW